MGFLAENYMKNENIDKFIEEYINHKSDEKHFVSAIRSLYERLSAAKLIADEVFNSDADPNTIFDIYDLLVKEEVFDIVKSKTSKNRDDVKGFGPLFSIPTPKGEA